MNNIKKLRMENNLTQKEFAKMLNVHQTAVSQWETNKTIPDVGIIKTMTELFGVSADYILGKKTVLTQQNANFFIFFSTFFQEMFKRSEKDFERALKENEAVFKTSGKEVEYSQLNEHLKKISIFNNELVEILKKMSFDVTLELIKQQEQEQNNPQD